MNKFNYLGVLHIILLTKMTQNGRIPLQLLIMVRLSMLIQNFPLHKLNSFLLILLINILLSLLYFQKILLQSKLVLQLLIIVNQIVPNQQQKISKFVSLKNQNQKLLVHLAFLIPKTSRTILSPLHRHYNFNSTLLVNAIIVMMMLTMH